MEGNQFQFFNITPFRWGWGSVDAVCTRKWIPIIKIRLPRDRLIYILAIPIHEKNGLYNETTTIDKQTMRECIFYAKTNLWYRCTQLLYLIAWATVCFHFKLSGSFCFVFHEEGFVLVSSPCRYMMKMHFRFLFRLNDSVNKMLWFTKTIHVLTSHHSPPYELN